MFHTCFYKDGNTENTESTNAITHVQQLSSNLPEGSIDKPGPDDVFSQVMGQNRNGDASMYGLGVRDSDVWGAIPSRSACRRENVQLKARCEELMVKLQAQEELNGSRDGSSVQPSSSYCLVVTDGPPCLRGMFLYKPSTSSVILLYTL